MTTSKADRAAPPRRFENYVLTHIIGTSLSRVSHKKFRAFDPIDDISVPNSSASDASGGNVTPIGFPFNLDGINYQYFRVLVSGAIVLHPPGLSHGTYFTGILDGSASQNELIKATFSTNQVIVAPWYDAQTTIQAVPNGASLNGSSINVNNVRRIYNGFQLLPQWLNRTQYGIVYCNTHHHSFGRSLIVRWTTLSVPSDEGAPYVLMYECVLYENGRIEFRYAPPLNFGGTATLYHNPPPEDASIGIWMPGAANRFRDFSYGLGYKDAFRVRHALGGAVYQSSYSDNGVPYTNSLNARDHWPGGTRGGMYIFSPPTSKKRVLPRIDIRQLDSNVERTSPLFSDQRTLVFGETEVVTYPTRLTRLYGDGFLDSAAQQGLFAGDFNVTASVNKGALDGIIEHYAEPRNKTVTFTDAHIDPTISGSSVDLFGTALSQPLSSKQKIEMTLNVVFPTQFPATTSSIYYYNSKTQHWNFPLAFNVSTRDLTTTPAGGQNIPNLQTLEHYNTATQRLVEDHHGFGPLGNFICSGSNGGADGSSDPETITTQFLKSNYDKSVQKSYDGSITLDRKYVASKEETFALPIQRPFVIEKMQIELPFAAGSSWFNSRTRPFGPIGTNAPVIDCGGPAITVALLNQIGTGNTSKRELILSGTFTHSNDTWNRILIETHPPIDSSTVYIYPTGFVACGATPAGVIPNSTTFTGSVSMMCESAIMNGPVVDFIMYPGGLFGSAAFKRERTLALLNSQNIAGTYDINDPNDLRASLLTRPNNFGRSADGMQMSGRSIFGQEFTAIDYNDVFVNKCYFTSSRGPITSTNLWQVMGDANVPEYNQHLASGSAFLCFFPQHITSVRPSPYIVFPNDRLILAATKTRPPLYSYDEVAPYTSASGGVSETHDAQLMTGSIKLTFFGSYMSEDRENTSVTSETPQSPAIRETIYG